MAQSRFENSPHLPALKEVSPELFAVAYTVSFRRRALIMVDQGLLARDRIGRSHADRADTGDCYSSSNQDSNDQHARPPSIMTLG